MAFINFYYERLSPNQSVTIDFDRTSTSTNILINDPSWANASVDGEQLTIRLNLGIVNQLPAGTYNGTVTLTEIWTDSNGDVIESIFLVAVPICLILTDRVRPTIDPTSLEFYYRIGNAAFPEDQMLTITPNGDFEVFVDQPWLNFDADGISTIDSTEIGVGVTIQGLIPGTYNGSVSIVGDLDTFIVPVTLVIDGELGTEDFLFITPEVLRFEFTRFGFIPNGQNVSVNASGDFTIESTSEWFTTSILQGNQNTLSFDVTLNSLLNALGVGVFVSEVIVRLGALTKRVAIEVEISQFIEELFEPDTLYFTDDENIIRLASSDNNTNLSVLIDVTHQQNLTRFKYSVPFFKGESKTYIGDETRKIIGALPIDFLEVLESKVYVPYTPAVLNFQLSENIIYTDTIIRGTSLQNIRFIKGITPQNQKLTKLPDSIYLTEKGFLSYSFLSDTLPSAIVISGAIDTEIPISVDSNELYSVLLPMETLGLSKGDFITVDVDGVVTNVQIKPDGIDQCVVFWENIWGCWDSFECTGKIKITNRHKYTKESYRINRNSIEEKTLEVDTVDSYSIDTGWIYSNAEVTFLSSLFQSRNVFLKIGDNLIKVNNKTSSFVATETRRFKKSFKLTFENAIQ